MHTLLSLAFLSMPRGGEWIIILLVVLIAFGGKKIPELMKGVGKGIKGFKEGLKGIEDEIKSDSKTDDDSTKK
jgi:sec-independent protein translocase protein TatA